jgi:hypothetical protein
LKSTQILIISHMHLHFNYYTRFISSNKVIEHSAKHNLAKHKRTHTGEKPYELTHVLLTHVLTLHFMKDNELLFLFAFQKRLLILRLYIF